jgi:hypothetical protein
MEMRNATNLGANLVRIDQTIYLNWGAGIPFVGHISDVTTV